ncbi:hypothetical protein RJ639_002836, partial [Escallonia herrerae]
ADEDYRGISSTFEQNYRCYPSHLEKVIMPPSALDRLAYLQIDYPMLFEVTNPSASKISHCGVLEFIADEGLIYLPYWMMENMSLQEGDIVNIKNASLSKGTFVKLQPHTKDFLDVSNPKAILETTLRNYSCLTTGDTIMVPYNNKKFYINIVETKPTSAVSIIETDCEIAKISAFTGSARRLDGKPSTQSVAPISSPPLKQHQPEVASGSNGSTPSSSSSRKRCGKLVFGSNGDQALNGTAE